MCPFHLRLISCQTLFNSRKLSSKQGQTKPYNHGSFHLICKDSEKTMKLHAVFLQTGESLFQLHVPFSDHGAGSLLCNWSDMTCSLDINLLFRTSTRYLSIQNFPLGKVRTISWYLRPLTVVMATRALNAIIEVFAVFIVNIALDTDAEPKNNVYALKHVKPWFPT